MNIIDEVLMFVREKIPSDKNHGFDAETVLYSLELSSIQFVLLLSQLEEKFDIEIEIDDIADLKTLMVGDIAKMVEEKV